VAHESFDAVVIGSGLGGLTAGALISHAGYRVLVLERNHSFGGAATTYQRGRMTIEASLHETSDPHLPAHFNHEVFEALGLFEDLEFVPVDNFYEVRGPLVGEPLTIPHGFDAVAAVLTGRFGSDEDAIRKFFGRLKAVKAVMSLSSGHHDVRWWLTHVPELPMHLWAVARDLRSSVSTVLDRYFGANEALKTAVAANVMYNTDDPDTMWWLTFVANQGGFLGDGGCFIRGGSQSLTGQLVARIHAGGGDARAGATVTEIFLDEKRRVGGVRYRSGDGTERIVDSPGVFANAAPQAVKTMLPEAEREPFMTSYRDRRVSISLFSINLGLDRPASDLGVASYSTVLVPDWFTELRDIKHCAAILAEPPGRRLPILGVCDRDQIDSGLRKTDLYTLNISGGDRLSNWDHLDDHSYQQRRDAWLDAVIARLDAEWPGIAEAVVERDMATARTMHRFLGTPGGAIGGFAPDTPGGIPRDIPLNPGTSIQGLWLASAYTGMGGFDGAMAGGAAAARAALRARHL
jgi:all-trans-retinol 13,14-reductase